jgi:hypothetical protein
MPRSTTPAAKAGQPVATGPGAEDREVHQSLVGVLRGGAMTIDQAAVGGVLAWCDVTISTAAAGARPCTGHPRVSGTPLLFIDPVKMRPR